MKKLIPLILIILASSCTKTFVCTDDTGSAIKEIKATSQKMAMKKCQSLQ